MGHNNQTLGYLLDNLIKTVIIIAIPLISLSISYYFVYFLPRQEIIKEAKAQKKDVERKEQENARLAKLNICLASADAYYRRSQKVKGKGAASAMPPVSADALEKQYKDARDSCYKQNAK